MKTEQIVILVVAFFLGMLLLNVVKNVCGCELEEGFQFYNNPQNPTRPDIWENLRKENRICKNDSGEILGKSIRSTCYDSQNHRAMSLDNMIEYCNKPAFRGSSGSEHSELSVVTKDEWIEACTPPPPPPPHPPISTQPCVDDSDRLNRAFGMNCAETIYHVPEARDFSGDINSLTDVCDYDLSAWLLDDLTVGQVCPGSCGLCGDASSQR